MKITVKKLNKGEIYCCSIKEAKKAFGDTSSCLSFTSRGMEFNKDFQHPLYRYVKKNVKGQVAFYMIVSTREETPTMYFFSMKESEITQELINKFNNDLVNRVKAIMNNQINSKSLLNEKKLVLVEFYNNNWILHETVLIY